MQKASSRLKQKSGIEEKAERKERVGARKEIGVKKEASTEEKSGVRIGELAVGWIRNYGQFFQVFVVALFFYLLVFLLMKNIPPARVANIFLPETYLPLQILLLAGNFFFFTFLWQSKKLGLVTAGLIASLLFWKLQGVMVTPLLVGLTILPWGLIAGAVIWKKYTSKSKTAK